MLRIDCDGFAVGEFVEIDAMPAAREAQLNAVMYQTFFLHPLANAHFGEQVHGSLLQDARSNPLLDILAAAILDDH
jgi:hypothetical protein